MKKLMIAMSAATIVALGAKAGVPEGYTTGTDFEGYKIVTEGDDKNDGKVIGFTDAGAAGDSLWTGAADDDSKVVAGQHLAVDSTSGLTRSAGEVAGAIPKNGGNITISTKVQFTAADDDQVAADGDKILVWAKAPEDGAEDQTIKLMVTAMDDETGEAASFYTGKTVIAEKWYNLKVVAADNTKEGAQAPLQFTVMLDDADCGTYTSLVTEGGARATIASIGFKGTGAVDDIGFVANEGEVIPDVTVSATVATGYTVAVCDGEGADIETAKVGDAVKIVVTKDEGDFAANTTVTAEGLEFAFDGNEGGYVATYTLTTADGEAGAKAFAVTVVEGEPEPDPIQPTVTKPETVTLEGVAASYKAGDTIDPTAIRASTTKNGYTVKVTVKVGDDVITEATVLKAGDEVTVTAEEEAITYTITYTYVDAEGVAVEGVTNENATEFTVESDEITIDTEKISKDGYTVTSVTPATIAAGTYENKEVTVVLTAIPTYTVTAAEVDGATVTFSTTDAVVSGTTVTFTVAVTDDTKEIDTVKAGETELTATEGVYSVTVADANIVITVTLKAKSVGPELPETVKGGSAEQQSAYADWAAANNITDVKAEYADAFALNVAPEEAQDKLDELITAEMVAELAAKLASGETTVTIEGYPNATFKFVPVNTIKTDAKLFKLSVEFKSAN